MCPQKKLFTLFTLFTLRGVCLSEFPTLPKKKSSHTRRKFPELNSGQWHRDDMDGADDTQ